MALQTFSVGSFMSYPDVAEWDGSNHDEIAEWLNRLDQNTDPATGWRVTAVTDRSVTFFKSAEPDDPTWPDRELTIARGQWLCAETSASAGSRLKIVYALDPAGKWRTDDRHGRPGGVDDLIKTIKGKR